MRFAPDGVRLLDVRGLVHLIHVLERERVLGELHLEHLPAVRADRGALHELLPPGDEHVRHHRALGKRQALLRVVLHVVHDAVLRPDALGGDVDQDAPLRVDRVRGDVRGDGPNEFSGSDPSRQRDGIVLERRVAEVASERPRTVLGDFQVLPKRGGLLGRLHRQGVVLAVQAELAVVPPVALLPDVDRAEEAAIGVRREQLGLERRHAVPVRPRRRLRLVLRDHDRDVRLLLERHRHPEVRVAVHLRGLGLELRRELGHEAREHLGAEREGAEGGSDGGELPESREQSRRGVVGHLLHLRRLSRGVDRDEAVLIEALGLPVRLVRHGPHLREDVRVVRARRVVPRAGDEDLIAPKHRASPGAVLRVHARLANHRLQDGELGRRGRGARRGVRGEVHQARELHPGLVVVLRAGEGREPRALARGVVDADGAAPGEEGVEVVAGRLGLGLGLGVRVERAEAVARAVGGPVLVHGDDDRARFRRLARGRLEPRLPVPLLRDVGRAHDDGVETLGGVHLPHRGRHRGAFGSHRGLPALGLGSAGTHVKSSARGAKCARRSNPDSIYRLFTAASAACVLTRAGRGVARVNDELTTSYSYVTRP